MTGPEAPRRRWLTQERTVLLVVSLVVAIGLGWLGWQAQIARHRRAMREQLEATGKFLSDLPYTGLRTLIRPAERDSGIPSITWLFGDEYVAEIWLESPLGDSDREAIAAFPEAEVVMIDVSSPRPAPPLVAP